MTDEELFTRLPADIRRLILQSPESADKILSAIKRKYQESPTRELLRFMALSYIQLGRDGSAIKCLQYEEETFGECQYTRLPLLNLYQVGQAWQRIYDLTQPLLSHSQAALSRDSYKLDLFIFFRRACLNLKRYSALVRLERDLRPDDVISTYLLVDEAIQTLWDSDTSRGVSLLEAAIRDPRVKLTPEAHIHGVAHLALGYVKLRRFEKFLSEPAILRAKSLSGLRAEVLFSKGCFNDEAWDTFEESYQFDTKRTPLWWSHHEQRLKSDTEFETSKIILLWGNQGIGDQLGLIAAVGRALSAKKILATVYIAVEGKAVELAQDLFPAYRFIPLGDVPLQRFDSHYPLSSVLRFFPEKTWSRTTEVKPLTTTIGRANLRIFIPTYSFKFKILSLKNVHRILSEKLTIDQMKALTLVFGGYELGEVDTEEFLENCEAVEYHRQVNYKNDLMSIAGLIRTCDLTVGVANTYTILSGLLGVPTYRLSAEPDTGLRFRLLENTIAVTLSPIDDIDEIAAQIVCKQVKTYNISRDGYEHG